MGKKIIGKGIELINELGYEVFTFKKLGVEINSNERSGLGASGIPHIGSLGDAVRAYGVKLALENLGYTHNK